MGERGRSGGAAAGRRAWRRAVPLLAVLVVAAGCGGGGKGNAAASTSSSPSSTGTTGSAGSSASLEQQFVTVVKQVVPSVVQITTSSGLGSGVVYDDKGDIVTNDHVVLGSSTFEVQLASGGARLPATLVGSYAPDDLAVIRVKATAKLRPATFGRSSSLEVGDIVLAVGNPLAFQSSVTEGIVSAVGRTVVEPQGAGSPGATIADAIQTSAAINPGNSGGALVNLDGQVIGIPTLAAQDPQIGGTAVGIGFAIPSDTVTDIAGQIIAHGHVVDSHRADLGIYGYTVADLTGTPAGVGVQRVVSGGPADTAGIKAGSIITAVNGTAVTGITDLDRILAELRPGQKVPVKILTPDGSTSTVQVTLGTLPGTVGGG